MKRLLLFWVPRALTALYALLLGMFALDVFSENTGLSQTLVALAIHLIPTMVVVALLVMSWRWERTAGALCILTGAMYCSWGHFRWDWIAIIAGPLFLIGLLYLLDSRYRRTI
jgi:hypothetical protein